MKGAHAGKPAESFPKPANIAYVPVAGRTGLRASVESSCPVTFLEAFVEGTEPAKSCSAAEHFRVSLPYFMQRFDLTSDLELGVDGDTLVRLVGEGQGEVELLPGGRELLVHYDGKDLPVRLDIGRAERREAMNSLDQDGGPAGDPQAAPTPDADAPTHFGVDGRPAVVIPIKYD